jgi:hypothetical protein
LGGVVSSREGEGGGKVLDALAVWGDPVQDVVVESLLCLDHSTGGDGVQGEFDGGDTGEALSAAGPWNDPEVDLREADLRARISNAVLAREGELMSE